MTPIGICLQEAALPKGVMALRVAEVCILSADASATVSDRLDLALTLATELDAFFPFAPRKPPSLDQASAWARAQQTPLIETLHRLRGKAEVIMTLDAPPPQSASAETGRGWLQARAAHHAARSRLQAIGQRLAPGAVALQGALDGPVELAVLVDRQDAALCADRWAAQCPSGVTCRITGPWPAFVLASHFAPSRKEAA